MPMRPISVLALVLTLGAPTSVEGAVKSQGSSATASRPSSAGFPIAEVIAQIKRELQAAENTPGAAVGLNLDKVELNFALTKITEANGKISIGIPVLGGIEAGGSGTKKAEEISSLLVELVPPKPIGAMSGQEAKDFGITQAIVETRRQLLAGLNDTPKLDPSKVVITLRFVITRVGGLNGQVKFLVFTLGGGKALTSANSSSIALTFSKSKELQ